MSWLRTIILAAGVLILLAGTITFVLARARRFLALIWMALGVGLLLLVTTPDIMDMAGPHTYVLRIRLVMGLLSFLVLMITLEAVRRFAMLERYALLWVSTGAILFIFLIYPDAIGWLVSLTGMHYVSAILVVVFAFLLLVAFHFSIALSTLHENQKRIAQRTGMLELRIVELESKLAQAQRSPGGGTDRAEGAGGTQEGRRAGKA